jgi:hypothetical protein
MKARTVDLKWLPPGEEWDFRSITAAECRVACHWEYARQVHKATLPIPANQSASSGNKAGRGGFVPAIYRQAARELFPQAWGALTKEQRARILDSFQPIPPLQVRKLDDFLRQTQAASPEMMRRFRANSYVLLPNFSVFGVEVVIAEFEVWARNEAKLHRPSPRAKAAALPYDNLKWLAVLRVDEARQKACINFDKANDSLKAYRIKNPVPRRL